MIKHEYRLAAAAFALALAAMGTQAQAAQFFADKNGSVSVSATGSGDVYVAGSSVSISAPVKGDAFAAGGSVTVSGAADQGIFAAGANVSVTGAAGDDMHLIGGNVSVSGRAANDLFAFGGQVSIAPSAETGSDAVLYGGTVSLDAPVGGNVRIRGGNVTINGLIKGSADISAENLSFGPNASIGGKLSYSAPSEITLPAGIAGGGIEFRKLERPNRSPAPIAAAAAGAIILEIAVLFAMGILAMFVFRRKTGEFAQESYARFGRNLLYGLGTLVLLPIAAIIALATVIGAPAGFVAAAIYAALLVLGWVGAPILVGALIWRLFGRKEYPVTLWSVLAGSAAFALISAIPFVGWIFWLAFWLAALGTLARFFAHGLGALRRR